MTENLPSTTETPKPRRTRTEAELDAIDAVANAEPTLPWIPVDPVRLRALVSEVRRLRKIEAENLEWLAAARQLNDATTDEEERAAKQRISEIRLGNADVHIPPDIRLGLATQLDIARKALAEIRDIAWRGPLTEPVALIHALAEDTLAAMAATPWRNVEAERLRDALSRIGAIRVIDREQHFMRCNALSHREDGKCNCSMGRIDAIVAEALGGAK